MADSGAPIGDKLAAAKQALGFVGEHIRVHQTVYQVTELLS